MKARHWIAAALCIANVAWAGPLVTYTHQYGDRASLGQIDPGGEDPLSNGYVTVKDTNPRIYSRFADAFDFSALAFGAIGRFELTLSYARTDNGFFDPESWYVRPGGTPDQYDWFALDRVGNQAVSTTFAIDDELSPEFDAMIDARNFFFWFAEEAWTSNSFRLYSATLSIFGDAPIVVPTTPTNPANPANGVPEPATLALLGIALAGLGCMRRRPRDAD